MVAAIDHRLPLATPWRPRSRTSSPRCASCASTPADWLAYGSPGRAFASLRARWPLKFSTANLDAKVYVCWGERGGWECNARIDVLGLGCALWWHDQAGAAILSARPPFNPRLVKDPVTNKHEQGQISLRQGEAAPSQ